MKKYCRNYLELRSFCKQMNYLSLVAHFFLKSLTNNNFTLRNFEGDTANKNKLRTIKKYGKKNN